jgi:hypothetical protein
MSAPYRAARLGATFVESIQSRRCRTRKPPY